MSIYLSICALFILYFFSRPQAGLQDLFLLPLFYLINLIAYFICVIMNSTPRRHVDQAEGVVSFNEDFFMPNC